ncbi:MAG: NAD(P)/FAD-dependent oxidoreductase [Clostridiaceae bacterium]|nr:NAD(P)/FAD-dependent oxidoreductase [Clostridiaceae bacterium]
MPEPYNRQPRVCIIGAGLTGLVAAYHLTARGYSVILLESTLDSGGMVSSFSMGASRIEHIYHHIFTSDSYLIDLAGELGLSGRIDWYRPHDALYSGARLYPFSAPVDLLRYKAIPLAQRIKTGLSVLEAGRFKNWADLENQTAAGWLKRKSGSQAFQCLWRPLLRSKFDLDADDVSAVWIWNKFKLRGLSRDQRSGGEKLGYMRGSFSVLTDQLVEAVKKQGGLLLTGHTAMNISKENMPNGRPEYRVSCILENCATVEVKADAVVATLSGRQFASITTSLDLPDSYIRKVRSIRYKGDLCLILRLRQSLSPYYWTTVCDDLPFVVVVEHTRLTGTDPYGGHIVYLSRYLDAADRLWTQSDGDIYRQFVEGLTNMYPGFSTDDVLEWRLRRTRYAQPVIFRHYSQQMPEMNTPDPGIKLAGMAQIYPEDRGMNYAVRLGCEAAASTAAYLSGRAFCPDMEAGPVKKSQPTGCPANDRCP